MSIDKCQYTFHQLATEILPRHMAVLRSRIEQPTPMSEFAIKGVGVATLSRKFNLKSDFKGCYVLIYRTRPIYVGISQTVLRRLRQHVRGTSHFDATLAYKIAAARQPHNMKRAEAMTNKNFQVEFVKARQYIRKLNVAFTEIPNPLELYLFEAFCAMKLNTSKWNTFETH